MTPHVKWYIRSDSHQFKKYILSINEMPNLNSKLKKLDIFTWKLILKVNGAYFNIEKSCFLVYFYLAPSIFNDGMVGGFRRYNWKYS